MARPKKTTPKAKTTSAAKAASKRTPKKSTANTKRSSSRASPESAARNSNIASIKLLTGKPSTIASKGTRRPPDNPEVPQATIDHLNTMLNDLKTILDAYAQHLRSLDRRRLNGVGIKKMGFIDRAYELALENAEFLPHYLTLERFGTDIQYFMDFRSLVDLTTQIREKLWNITIQSSDIAYTDALEFYASVREAAKRRVDAAETIFNELSVFFRRNRTETEEPTETKARRDFNSLIHGKHDGKLVVENIRPKLTGGKRKIIDETFKDKAEFKDTIEGDIQE